MIKVKPFSPAYFALVQERAGTGAVVRDRASASGCSAGTSSIEVAPEGIEQLDAAALADAVRNW